MKRRTILSTLDMSTEACMQRLRSYARDAACLVSREQIKNDRDTLEAHGIHWDETDQSGGENNG